MEIWDLMAGHGKGNVCKDPAREREQCDGWHVRELHSDKCSKAKNDDMESPRITILGGAHQTFVQLGAAREGQDLEVS